MAQPDTTPSILRAMVIWTLLWFASSLIITNIVGLQNVESLKLYYVTVSYYVASATFAIYYYKVKGMMEHHDPFTKQLALIASLYVVSLVCGLAINTYFPIDEVKKQQIIATHLFFPLFTIETWSTKLAEIIFQQAFIFAILSHIGRFYEYSKKQKIWIFAITFSLIHVPLLMFFGWRGLYFIIPSIFAGFIFSYLILTYRLGLFYSFVVHILFYFAFGSVVRYIIPI